MCSVTVLQIIITHMKEGGEMCVLVYFCLYDCVHISFQLWLCTRRRLLRNQECCSSYFSSVQSSSVQLYCPCCGEICLAGITENIIINSKHSIHKRQFITCKKGTTFNFKWSYISYLLHISLKKPEPLTQCFPEQLFIYTETPQTVNNH